MFQTEVKIKDISNSINGKILDVANVLNTYSRGGEKHEKNDDDDKKSIHKMIIQPNPDESVEQSFIGFDNIPSHIHSLVIVSPDKHLSELGVPNDTNTVYPLLRNLSVDGHCISNVGASVLNRFPNLESLELFNGNQSRVGPMNISIPLEHPLKTLGLRGNQVATIDIANAPKLETLDITGLIEGDSPVKIGLTQGQRGSVQIVGGDKTKYELIAPQSAGATLERYVKEVEGGEEDTNIGGGPKKKLIIKETVKVKEEVEFPWINEGIAKYYEIKNNYESTCQIVKNRTIEALKKKNKKIKKGLISQIKYKCLYCARDVGSIFERTEDSLLAYCGDKQNPCEFKIEIYRGLIYNMEKYREIFKRDIEEAKENIMKTKMDSLFGYVTEKESVRIFKENMGVYTTLEEQLNELNSRHKALTSTPEKEAIIMKLIGQINECLKEIRDLIHQYKENGNERILQFAMEKQASILKPHVDKLREVRYEVKHMNQIGEKSYLVQYPYKFDELDPVIDRTAEGRVKAFRIKPLHL